MGEFTPAELVLSLSTDADDTRARFTDDELEVVFARRSGAGVYDLWTARRPSLAEPFGDPELLATVNSVNSDMWPTLSPDGLRLVFDADRATPGAFRVWSSRRPDRAAPFGPPALREELAMGEVQPHLANAAALYLASSTRPGLGAADIFRAELDADGALSEPVAVVGGVNTAEDERAPAVTADERQIFFRRTVNGEHDIYTATRSTAQDGFGVAEIVPAVSQPGVVEFPSWISPDGCHLYFHSNMPIDGGPAGYNIFVARRS